MDRTRTPINLAHEVYEARRASDGFFTPPKIEVSLPDASTAFLTSGNVVRFPGVISTAIAAFTVDRSRMRCGDRDVVRYVGGGIYKSMRAIHFSDLECGREYFLCWSPSGAWFNTNLVLLENGCDVGSYYPNLGRREDGLFDHGSGDTLLLIPGISAPIALLILWIGTLGGVLSED